MSHKCTSSKDLIFFFKQYGLDERVQSNDKRNSRARPVFENYPVRSVEPFHPSHTVSSYIFFQFQCRNNNFYKAKNFIH